MFTNRALTALTALAALGMSLTPAAAATREQAVEMLHEKGYHHIQLGSEEKPGHLAWACKQDTHFRIDIDANGNIVDVDPVGECDRATGPADVHVDVPFADVRVGDNGVHVRVPFVDLKVD